jgi:hypothetical protein
MDEFEQRLAQTRAMSAMSPDEIREALGIPPGEMGFFEGVSSAPWDAALLDRSADLPELDRFAEEIAARFAAVAPEGASVWARYGVVVIESGSGSQVWADLQTLHRDGCDRAGLARIALGYAQDEFTEIQAWPWPGDTSDFPEPSAREADGHIELWYGAADDPVLRLPPIELA